MIKLMFIIIPIISFLIFVLFNHSNHFDYGQCNKRCQQVYGSIAPFGIRIGGNHQCQCSSSSSSSSSSHGSGGDDKGEAIQEVISRYNPIREPSSIDDQVCSIQGEIIDKRNAKNLSDHTRNHAVSDHIQDHDILHGGPCGACSNSHDIEIYKKTNESLTGTATYCALVYLIFGRDSAKSCLSEYVGFTSQCESCWLDNMACTIVHCSWICLKEKIILRRSHNNDSGELSDCLACDETFCGPDFVDCAGANRRRIGITSDIGRKKNEIWPKKS